MQISTAPYWDVLALDGQRSQPRNIQNINDIQDVTVPKLNWKANPTCYKYGEKLYLAQTCPDKGSSAVTQSQQPPTVNTQQTSCYLLGQPYFHLQTLHFYKL